MADLAANAAAEPACRSQAEARLTAGQKQGARLSRQGPFTNREKDYSFGVSCGAGTSARSSSPGSSGSSSSRKAGSSDGIGTVNPGGSRPSNRPEPLSSSSPGRSPTASRPKCERNASLV